MGGLNSLVRELGKSLLYFQRLFGAIKTSQQRSFSRRRFLLGLLTGLLISACRRQSGLYLLASLTGVFLVACQQGNLPQNSGFQSQEPSSNNCRLVKHDAGETTVCDRPQKVAALSPRALDVMLSLGIQPAGYAEDTLFNFRQFDNPSEQIPYLGERITTQPINLGDRDNPSLETLVLLRPDLIVAVENGHALYEQLSKIAPTLVLENGVGKEFWQRHLQVVAQAFDREEQAKQVIAKHQQQLAKARDRLAPVVATYPRVLPIALTPQIEPISVYSYNSDAAELLEAIGFQLVLLEQYPHREQHQGISPKISVEALSQLDADIIIVLAWDHNNNLDHPQEAVKQRWEQHPILQNLPASREGRVYFVNSDLWGSNIGGPITDELILERLPRLLLPAVEGATKSQ
ncbi:iron-siderophore ABC transporter substrate-binding protein [Pleurocapsales cyanobacterium LEGE 06147]|nr:iron-siderophore ABC transporter substrate-binding protein [Pleurocapsales cyanobacterium LEGE 06147]